VHLNVLARLVDAVLVLIDDIELNDLKLVGAWICSFREVAADDLDLDATKGRTAPS
jgi:hypothetical protein